jgi:hypothetical protein
MRTLALLTAITLGCGGTDGTGTGPQLLSGFHPPAPPANGFQIVLPIQRGVQPGADMEMCTWTDRIAAQDMDIKTVEGFQTETGHHVILYAASIPSPAGTRRECSGTDTIDLRFAAGSGGEGTSGPNTAPGNLVYRIPAGTQLVVNEHFLNATQQVKDAQSVVNITLADPNTPHVPSGSLAFVDASLRVPTGNFAYDVDCTMERSLKAWFFIPHMHRWGSHITIDKTQSGAAAPEHLFDVDWNPEYTFHPPEIRRDPSMPFNLSPGDKIHIHCEWNNDTSAPLTFGMEMCVAYAAYVDDQGIGNLVCNKGHWGSF